jgi:probable rRNA maturation factor
VTVHVINRQKRRIRRRWLERVAEAIMVEEGCHPEAELSVAIGDDQWIQALNRKYLKKDSPTDVLAFPQDLSPGGAEPLLGDVAISAETAARQAAEMGHTLEEELALLLAHGILHLTGWGDESPARRRRMLRRGEEVTRAALERLEA